jgi:2-polyprenyl-6-methoxyphenol hydroxylase-like FAD-dependent oxidoreductase
MDIKRALIIGGGIAGPALALFLKKAGVHPQVFEALPQEENPGAGLNIAANGINVLASLDLAEKVIAAGHVIYDGILKNAKNKKLAQFRYTDIEQYGSPNVNLSRPVLTQLLREELMLQDIPILYEKRLDMIIQSITGIEAVFSDGSCYSADILIGADGIKSRVREFVLEQPVDPSFTGLIGSGGFVDKALIPELTPLDVDNLNFVYGTTGFFGYGGVSTEKLMWWTNYKAAHPFPKDSVRNFDIEQERADLLTQYGSYAFPIPEIIKHSENFVRVNVFDVQSLPNWYKNRISLIGDAAHAMSPNSGQGASIALEDAMVLAKLIKDENSYSAAFKKFEELRRPRVEKIVAEGRKRGDDKTIVSPVQQFIREWMIRIFVNLFAEKGNKWLLEYKVDWDSRK